MSLTVHEQNQLVTDNMDLVGHIVAEVSARYPRHVDRTELWNAGALGLVEASRRFDPQSGIPFARYAAIRIRRNIRDIQQAHAGLEEQNGRTPTAAELAAFLGITLGELSRRQAQATTSTLLHLDQHSEADESPLVDRVEETRSDNLPEFALEQREMRGTLVESVRNLPAIQAEVISRYYLEGELLQDIAEDLGLTEARVSQIRSEALMAMRGFFGTQFEGVEQTDESAPGKRARAAYIARMAETSTWKSRIEAETLLDPAIRGEVSLVEGR
jgi:RNA polymerase sigma factor FliA